MKISVIVRTCNRPDFLEQALCSIELQTHKDWEVIVFDDGDSSQNQKIVNDFKKRNPQKLTTYINSGGSYHLFKSSWIMAPKISEGDVMIRLDDDDILDVDTLGFIDEAFTKNPELDFAYGSSILFRDSKLLQIMKTQTPRDIPKSRDIWAGYMTGYPFNHPWKFVSKFYDEPKNISSIIHASKLNHICIFHPYIMRTSSVLKVLDRITITSNFVDDLEFLGSLDNLGLRFTSFKKILTYVRKHDSGSITDKGKEINGVTLWDNILWIRDKVDFLRPNGTEFQSNVVDVEVEGNFNNGRDEALTKRFIKLKNDINEILKSSEPSKNPSKNPLQNIDWRLF